MQVAATDERTIKKSALGKLDKTKAGVSPLRWFFSSIAAMPSRETRLVIMIPDIFTFQPSVCIKPSSLTHAAERSTCERSRSVHCLHATGPRQAVDHVSCEMAPAPPCPAPPLLSSPTTPFLLDAVTNCFQVGNRSIYLSPPFSPAAWDGIIGGVGGVF